MGITSSNSAEDFDSQRLHVHFAEVGAAQVPRYFRTTIAAEVQVDNGRSLPQNLQWCGIWLINHCGEL